MDVQGDRVGSRSGILAPKLLTALVGDQVVLTRTDSSSLERIGPEGTLRPWFDYPAANSPVGDMYPDIMGAHRYDLLPESIHFVPGEARTSWIFEDSVARSCL